MKNSEFIMQEQRLTHFEKGKQSLRFSNRSKFSRSIVQGSKLEFSQLDSVNTECSRTGRLSCATDSCGLVSNSLIECKARNVKIKIYYLILKEIVNEKCPLKCSSTQTIKGDFIIDYVIIDSLELVSKVIELVDCALKKINQTLKGGFDYFFAQDSPRYSLRASKRSGLPDFDLPGKFYFCLLFIVFNSNAELKDLTISSMTLCFGGSEEQHASFKDCLIAISKSQVVSKECKCLIF